MVNKDFDPNKVLFRCSQLGKLMTEPRSKSESLSETTKTYLLEVFLYEKYGRKKDIVSKYIQKGLMVEEDSITLYSRVKKEFFKKNEENLKNEFVKGTPDSYEGDEITKATLIKDFKSSWDIYTFWDSKLGDINKIYYWQLHGYMWLTGAKKAQLIYCLVDTPDVLIIDAKRKFMWNAGIIDENPITDEVFPEMEHNMYYEDIPLKERICIKDLEYNEVDILKLQSKISECRMYIDYLNKL